MKEIVIVVNEGFNELDAFAPLHILNRSERVAGTGPLRATLVSASPRVRSMYGVQLEGLGPLSQVQEADAVIVGSGGTLKALENAEFLEAMTLDPRRQLVASQCSGALVLARLGLLQGIPACTDLLYRPHLQAAGVEVLDQPFHAQGNVATAGGCLASVHLAAWVLVRLLGAQVAHATLASVAPVGGDPREIERVLEAVTPPAG